LWKYHEQDVTEIIDILTDITDAIPTDENGSNQIPAGETLAFNSQINNLQTQINTKTSSSNVDNLIDIRLLHQGLMDENFQSLVYNKTEVDALIPDTSNFETSNQLDNRLANYTTLSLFEAHEELMEQELNDKQDVPATGEQFAFVSQLPNLSNYALSSAIPDVSSFITDQTSNLANYDTSTEVDTKISNAGLGTNPVVDTISLNGGTIDNYTTIDADNMTNGYIKFAPSISGNDWAYLRQIGGANEMKLALDFHDDGDDAVFVIRDIHSSGQVPDLITNRFEIKRGGDTEINGNVRIPGDGKEIYFDTGGAGLRWGQGLTRIVDDGDLQICTDDNMHFNTGSDDTSLGTERMVIKSDGKVGINVSNPASILHMNPNTENTESPETTGCYVYNTNTGDASLTLRVKNSSAGHPYISFDVAGEAGWALGMDNDDGNKFKLNYGWSSLSNNTKMTTTPDG